MSDYTLVDDYYDLVRFARGRVLEGHEVESLDDPKRRRFGFVDKTTGEQFGINLTNVLSVPTWWDSSWEKINLTAELVRALTPISEGRQALFGHPELETKHEEILMELVSKGWG